MYRGRTFVAIALFGGVLVIAATIALLMVRPARAQCGSQASSCKNCHETQAKDPVNNDGTGWHESHAFGDFCYICHGGNNQATDETASHAGMVAPLSDIRVACGQCHPNDLQARAEVYAAKLGVPIDATSAAQSASTPTAPALATSAEGTTEPLAAVVPAVTPNAADLTDYVVRYNQTVLHQQPTNWGNVILLVMIAAMVVGGGGLVITHEGLVRVSFKDTKPVTGEYPADVVEMVPDIARLKPGSRRSLQRILKKPDATADLLDAVDKLTEKDQAE